jgi:hypothetical protein
MNPLIYIFLAAEPWPFPPVFLFVRSLILLDTLFLANRSDLGLSWSIEYHLPD